MLPTIHLNGTSATELAEQYQNAAMAIQDAVAAMQKAAPNARDYYVQGNHAIGQAIQEHIKRLELLDSIYKDIEQLWMHCSDATMGAN